MNEQKRVTFGGAIKKARKRSPRKNEKIQQALAAQAQVGGAIKKARKRSPRKNEKIQQALAAQAQVGGRLKFHDAKHKYLYQKLTGRGGRKDSPQCRSMMHSIMSKYHPSIWQSYIAGGVKDHPTLHPDHDQPPLPRKRDIRPHVVETGGSLNAITHSEDGYLTSHNAEFHPFYEIV